MRERRRITYCDAKELGFNEMSGEFTPRDAKKGHCIVCGLTLPKRRRSICSTECRVKKWYRFYQGIHWQKRLVFIRDGAACRCCGEVFESAIVDGGPVWPILRGLELDHIEPVAMTHNYKASNLQLLCVACHLVKTKRDCADIRFARRP